MDAIKISEYARALYNSHGDKAEAEAAQKVKECEKAGQSDQAKNWTAIRQAIRSLRGPNQS